MKYIYKGAKLGGATGARAPVVFIPRPKFLHICASLFESLPEVLYIGAPLLFYPVWCQCKFENQITLEMQKKNNNLFSRIFMYVIYKI